MKKAYSKDSGVGEYLKNIQPAFKDKRGMIIDILEDKDIKHIGLIISSSGSIRGNHYHKEATQWTYVIDGKIKLHFRDMKKKDSQVDHLIMGSGDIIELPPFTIHTIEALEKSTLLILTNKSRKDNSYEYDTFRIKIV